MTGTHSEGKRRERELCKWLTAQFGGVWWCPPMGKYESNDIFGVFDVVGISQTGYITFAQLCDKKSLAQHRRSMRAFYEQHFTKNATYWLFSYDKKKEPPYALEKF